MEIVVTHARPLRVKPVHRRRIYGTDKVRTLTAAHRRGDERYYRPPPSWRVDDPGGEPRTDAIAYPWYTFGFVQPKLDFGHL